MKIIIKKIILIPYKNSNYFNKNNTKLYLNDNEIELIKS